MGERKGTKGLELWCRRMTEGYPGVNVTNMTTSWRDGLAFCAIIHHFRPDLIEFSKLNKDNIYFNNELAFRTAEHHLGIPALLEPEDMVEFPVPDRLSILTYLSQFYQTFVVGQGKSPSRIAPKRPTTSPEHNMVSPASTSPPTKVVRARREPCAKCGHPVFIAERLNVGKLLYHRTCFRCARCTSQLTLADYYETEEGAFCCETCPDEEKKAHLHIEQVDSSSVLTRSLSDEEKSASLKKNTTTDDYSALFETALEDLTQYQSFDGESVEQETQTRSVFSGFPKVETHHSVSSVVESQDVVTKDADEGNTGSSLVRARMRLFESKADDNDATNEVPSKTNVVNEESSLHSFNNNIMIETSFCDSINDSTVITISDSQSDRVEESYITISDDSNTKPDEEDAATKSNSVGDEESPHPVAPSGDVTIHNQAQVEETNNKSEPEVEVRSKQSEEYPDDLNPFDEDEPVPSLNPFEDEEDASPVPSPKPAVRKKVLPSSTDRDLSLVYIKRISVNPFEEEEETAPQPARRKVVPPPRITLNPFWSDDEDKEQEDKPVPKPRTSKSSGLSGSLSSVSSTLSKKKKPAPKPPTGSGPSSLTSSPSHSVTHSPRGTPKIRKNRKAPPPPCASSTPLEGSSAPTEIDTVLGDEFEKEKSAKDEVNRNRQSQNLSLQQSPSSSENSSSLGAPNKSTYGKWKRRKGQAPARPIPQRRAIKTLPLVEVRRELELIEIQQLGLEKQGVRLEQIIRERCEGPEVNPDESLPPEIEDMVLQLFELVNEKNELFRRQAELMYLRRQNKLEEEHAEVEYQIRCLMLQPEANKTDSDKAREEELISRLVEIVERRNEIIECLEMDRVREAEEDDSINNQLNLYTSKKEDKSASERKAEKKEKKKHRKERKFKLKSPKVDADKDIDESESSTSLVKEKKKKKFNIF